MILQSITHSAHCRILNKVYIFLLTLCCTMYHVFLIIIMLYLALYWSKETVQPVHFSFYPFWGAKNSSFLYFNFVGLFSLFNFFFINDFFFILCHIYIHIYYILSQYVHALLVFNHPIILLFTFCFFIEHVYMYLHISICYFFHPFVMFIIFIQQYFASCHVEVSLFSFEYLHTVVCLLPVVYLPVVGLIHYQYTTHYRDCSHIFPYCLKREQYRAAIDNLYFSYRCACRSVMVIFFSYHYKWWLHLAPGFGSLLVASVAFII